MRDWPTDLKTMLAGSEITRCYLIEMTSRNGLVVRMTDFSSDIDILSSIFVADPGFQVTQIRTQSGGSPPQVDLQLPISVDGPIYAQHVRRGVWRGGSMALWLVDFTDPSATQGLLVDGFVGNVQYTDELITSIELLSRGDATADIVLPRVQPKCRHVFGDHYCGFPVGLVTLDGTLDTVIDNGKFTITVTNPSALDFNGGAIKMTSGANAGVSLDIRKWTSGSSLVELWDPFPLDLEDGDTFSIHAGCAHTRAACAAYANAVHYGGYDHVPGQTYVTI